MKYILIDTSIWIEYFRGSKAVNSAIVDNLIDNNQICVNNLILSELLRASSYSCDFQEAYFTESA